MRTYIFLQAGPLRIIICQSFMFLYATPTYSYMPVRYALKFRAYVFL